MKYVPISFKSDFSLLKSLLKTSDIIDYAVKNNGKYIGILDENMGALMDFYEKCQKKNLKCIFGMITNIGGIKIYLYIKNQIGYKNLLKINDLKNDTKLTYNDIFKYNEGLIAVLPYDSYNLFNRFKTVFEVYLGYKNETELKSAIMISKKVLFINEILYINKEDAPLLKILYKIDGRDYSSSSDYVIDASEFDVKTIDEFQSHIDLEFEFDKRYIPKFCKTEEESRKYLYTLAIKGLSKRLGCKVSEEYKKRLSYELDVITKMGFVDYFLIVFDYVKYARKNDIYAQPRGSAAGSLVSYAIGITDVDPMKYNLLFERFLNPERVTMPDIDMDFEDTRRGEVIDYVRKKYGEDNVSLIIAYGTLGSRQVLRDVGKSFKVDNDIIDKLCKIVDAKKSLKENLKKPELVSFVKENDLSRVYKISMRLEGLKKHTTIHAAGVIISSENLHNLVPIVKSNDGILTGYTMEYLEKLGLLKMDFLALRNLTTMHNIINLVCKKNSKFDIKNISLNDPATFKIFQSANTDNIFQFESAGMKKFLKMLEPSTFDDLVAANALFRPGPMDNIEEYVLRRKGKKEINYLHPDLKPILENTYGIIVYQEQIMQILSKMGGYSFAEADLIRRAMSKKKHDVMEQEKIKFIKGATERGYTKECATVVYDLIVKFANYGFNKSHSVAYALMGYQMAYLKAHYLDLFHLNTLNMNMGSEVKTKDVIEDAKNKGFTVVKPDINKSSYEYVMESGKIILPLTSIKNVGSNVSKIIIDSAPYKDFFDFFRKIYGNSINRSLVETLIKAGAMDSFGYSKKTLLKNIDSAITYVELSNDLDESLIIKPDLVITKEEDDEYSDLDIFGFYVGGHPASKFENAKIVKIRDLVKWKERNVTVGVLVEKVKVINTKKGEKMAFVDVSDDTGKVSAVIFPRSNSIIDNIEEDNVYMFKSVVGEREKELQLIINEIEKEEK